MWFKKKKKSQNQAEDADILEAGCIQLFKNIIIIVCIHMNVN